MQPVFPESRANSILSDLGETFATRGASRQRGDTPVFELPAEGPQTREHQGESNTREGVGHADRAPGEGGEERQGERARRADGERPAEAAGDSRSGEAGEALSSVREGGRATAAGEGTTAAEAATAITRAAKAATTGGQATAPAAQAGEAAPAKAGNAEKLAEGTLTKAGTIVTRGAGGAVSAGGNGSFSAGALSSSSGGEAAPKAEAIQSARGEAQAPSPQQVRASVNAAGQASTRVPAQTTSEGTSPAAPTRTGGESAAPLERRPTQTGNGQAPVHTAATPTGPATPSAVSQPAQGHSPGETKVGGEPTAGQMPATGEPKAARRQGGEPTLAARLNQADEAVRATSGEQGHRGFTREAENLSAAASPARAANAARLLASPLADNAGVVDGKLLVDSSKSGGTGSAQEGAATMKTSYSDPDSRPQSPAARQGFGVSAEAARSGLGGGQGSFSGDAHQHQRQGRRGPLASGVTRAGSPNGERAGGAEAPSFERIHQSATRGTDASARGAAQSAEIVPSVIQQIERMRRSGTERLTIGLPMENGERLDLRLRMLGGNRVEIELLDAPAALEQDLRAGWGALADEASARGLEVTFKWEADASARTAPQGRFA